MPLSDRVELTGLLPDPYEQIQQSQVVLVCGAGEAFGRATVEAMLLGKPVVASDSGANSEVLGKGNHAILYPPGEPAGLARAVESMLDNLEAATEAARSRQAWASEYFSMQRFFAEWWPIVNGASSRGSQRT